MTKAEIDNIVRQELSNWRTSGEFWAADIARVTGQKSNHVFAALQRIEHEGTVVRLSKGRSSRWKTTVPTSRKLQRYESCVATLTMKPRR